jgi:hypothetical protein
MTTCGGEAEEAAFRHYGVRAEVKTCLVHHLTAENNPVLPRRSFCFSTCNRHALWTLTDTLASGVCHQSHSMNYSRQSFMALLLLDFRLPLYTAGDSRGICDRLPMRAIGGERMSHSPRLSLLHRFPVVLAAFLHFGDEGRPRYESFGTCSSSPPDELDQHVPLWVKDMGAALCAGCNIGRQPLRVRSS